MIRRRSKPTPPLTPIQQLSEKYGLSTGAFIMALSNRTIASDIGDADRERWVKLVRLEVENEAKRRHSQKAQAPAARRARLPFAVLGGLVGLAALAFATIAFVPPELVGLSEWSLKAFQGAFAKNGEAMTLVAVGLGLTGAGSLLFLRTMAEARPR